VDPIDSADADAGELALEPAAKIDASVPARSAEPPVATSALLAAAYRTAGLDRDPTPGWRRRARLASLVPWVTVRDGSDAAWHDITDPTIAYVSIFEVSAAWHFDRLVFDPNEMRAATIAGSRRRERRRVADLVIRAYYDWRRAVAGTGEDTRWSWIADEARDRLDSLTDGWFSQNLPPSSGPAKL
jgi:hypothetical protein